MRAHPSPSACPTRCETSPDCLGEHSTVIKAVPATGADSAQYAVDNAWTEARVPLVSVRVCHNDEDDAPSLSLLAAREGEEVEVYLRAHEVQHLAGLLTKALRDLA